MIVQPYLFFNGRADEALDFYKMALGAEPGMVMRFKENPGGTQHNPPGSDDKVMHMEFKVGGKTSFQGFALCIGLDSVEEAKKMEAALMEGGSQSMPSGETFFARYFAAVTDKFGVQWMLLGGAKQ